MPPANVSRLGRGGGGVGSRMRGTALPFDIDPELVEAADKSFEDDDEDDSGKEVYPVSGSTGFHEIMIENES